MLYGLVSTISFLQACLDNILIDIGKFTIAYIGDILVYSHSLEEHIKWILQRLLENNLFENAVKF